MKVKLLLFLFLFINSCLFGQKNKIQLECVPYIRWDKYPEFTYAINPVNSNKVNISSTSWGINTTVKVYLKHQYAIKAGLGFYQFSFDKIKQVNSLFGKSDNRIIEDYYPPDSITPSIIFRTNKYFYNTITINIAIERQIMLPKEMQINYGFMIVNYYTFSQHYHITYPYPRGDEFKKTSIRWFGFSACLNVSLQRRVKKIIVGPTLILPVFDLWKKDTVFPEEENNESRTKLSDGVGVGLKVTIPLK